MDTTNRKRKYSSAVSSTIEDIGNRKRLFRSTNLKVERNIFTQNELDILTNDAKQHRPVKAVYHGDDSSKRFCFNAIFNQNKESITNCHSLFNSLKWDSLDEDLRKVVVKGITKAVSYHQSMMTGQENQKVRLVCFELIHVPFDMSQKVKIIPGLPWHSDEGYDRNNEPFCYADTTTVFMLTDPSNWLGANLQFRDIKDQKDTKNINDFITHKYAYNNAVTFINKGTEHRVTRLRPINIDSSRIVLIISVYGSDETKTYLDSV